MTRSQFQKLIVTWVVLTAVAYTVILVKVYAQPAEPISQQTAAQAVSAIESLRIIGGLMGIAFGLLGSVLGVMGAVAYWKVGIQTKQNESLQETVTIYRDKIDALEMLNDDLTKSKANLASRIDEKDQALLKLQSKTDLTALMNLLTEFIKASETRYAEGVKVVKDLQDAQVKLLLTPLEEIRVILARRDKEQK